MKPGDITKGTILTPLPLWNRTSPPDRQLPDKCEVHEVILSKSQTGVLVRVKFKDQGFKPGGFTELDAGWFEECQKNQQGDLKL